jgi:hypothetical protein
MLRVGAGDEAGWVSVLDADNMLLALRAQEERTRALARREVRLPEARRRVSWGRLTAEEKRVLTLSQKEYNSFRARTGAGAAAPQAPQAGPAGPPQGAQAPDGNGGVQQAPPATPHDDHGEDGGDDASDEEE